MLRHMKKYNFLCFCLLFMLSCQNNHTQDNSKHSVSKETSILVNKNLVQKYNEMITAYVKRRGWDMIQTKTGLWYMIYEKGTGQKAAPGRSVSIHYKIDLLDGTHCYMSDSASPKQFLIGQGGVESGLEEGILYLREGDKAKFIIPPYLAHGLLGDEDKIPPLSIIVYDINVIKIFDKK